MILTGNGYSKGQLALFKLLPKSGKQITTEELMRRRQMKNKWKVDFPRQGVTGAMQGLIRKVEKNREAFRICKSRPAGPKQTCYWIEFKHRGEN